MRLAKSLDDFSDSVATYRKRIDQIAADKKMSSEDKKVVMDKLAHKIIEAAKARNEMYRKLLEESNEAR